MKAVRRSDTEPELRLRRSLWRRGLRYRKHPRIADTRPDLAFLGPRIAVFVDGCFWHGCPDHYVAPVNNGVFWREKLKRNKALDRRVTNRLEDDGWLVVRIWECQLSRGLDTVSNRLCLLVDGRSSRPTCNRSNTPTAGAEARMTRERQRGT